MRGWPWTELPSSGLDVAVGGLGLGFTAVEVLADPRVRSLVVVERLGEVIEWHQRALIPAGATLVADERCRLVQGDFFAMVAGDGLDPAEPGRLFHAIVVDIDHSPTHLLAPGHAGFYDVAGTHGSPLTCILGGSSRFGPTTRRTVRTRRCSARSSMTWRPRW